MGKTYSKRDKNIKGSFKREINMGEQVHTPKTKRPKKHKKVQDDENNY